MFSHLTSLVRAASAVAAGISHRVFLAEALERRVLLSAAEIGLVTMPYDGALSAAVYDADGRFIKTLFQTRPGTAGEIISLEWNGTDDRGVAVANNTDYEWRAAFSQARGVDQGGVGDSGEGPFGITEWNGPVGGLATEPGGSWYTSAYFTESHKEIRKYNAQGVTLWYRNAVGSYGGIASDGTSVYVARAAEQSGGEDRIYRYDAQFGEDKNFTGGTNYIAIHTGRTTGAGEFEDRPIRGLAVDSARLWLTDYFADRVQVRDKSTGAVLGALPIANPLGIVVQSEPAGATPGAIWVAAGSEVRRYTFTIDGGGQYLFVQDTARTIGGLGTPIALALGPGGHLFVAEHAGRIRQYNISGAGAPVPAGLGSFGTPAAPGPVGDTTFRDVTGITVGPDGVVSVADSGNRRIQRFSGGGALVSSMYSEFQPSPFADKFNGSTNRLISGTYEYEVSTDNTPHAGWYNGGTWRLAANWIPADRAFYPSGSVRDSVRRTLDVNGAPRDFLFFTNTDVNGVIVYDLGANSTQMRRAAIVGNRWIGLGGNEAPTGGRYVWIDTDGQGDVEAGEINWDVPQGEHTPFLMTPWVDEGGNIWYPNGRKLALNGFDAAGNPQYDWSQAQQVLPVDQKHATRIRTDAAGNLYQTVDASYFFNGGRTVRQYDASGNFKTQYTFQNGEQAGAIAVVPDGSYWMSGHNSSGFGYDNGGRVTGQHSWVDVWTPDNLRVATLLGGAISNFEPNWYDHGEALHAGQDPSGNIYVYGEEVYYGKSMRWRVDKLDSIQRLGRTFSWPPDPVIVSISATDPLAGEGGDGGAFTVSRNTTAGDLTVYYSAAGTATNDDLSSPLVSSARTSESFDNLLPGPINGQDGWVGENSHTVDSGAALGATGNVLHVSSGTASKSGFFQSSSIAPKQQVTFDFRLATDSSDYIGTPNVGVQHEVLTVRGPNPTGNAFFLVYRLLTDSTGQLFSETLELRGANGTSLINGVQKDVWYRATMQLDFTGNVASISVTKDGQPWFQSSTVSGYDSGNVGQIYSVVGTAEGLYLDNIQVIDAWNPAGLGSVVIPDGASSASIPIAPINDSDSEGDETVRLILAPNPAYAVSPTDQDVVVITDDDVPPPGAGGPTVSVTSGDTSAAEAGADGASITFTRTGGTATPLTVFYTVGGNAGSGDLSASPALTGQVTIPPGSATATITVDAADDGAVEASESVVVRLSPAASYVVAATQSVTVTLVDDDQAAPTVTVAASDATASEAGANTGALTISRTGGLSAALWVHYLLQGTASPADYAETLSGSVLIPAGAASVPLTITPTDDALIESDETLHLVLAADSAYAIGAAGNAAVLIDENDKPTVGVVADDAQARESDGDPARFTFTRNSSVGDLTVHYDVAGSADAGDYAEALVGRYKETFDGLPAVLVDGRNGWNGASRDRVVPRTDGGQALLVERQAWMNNAFAPASEAPQQRLAFDVSFGRDASDFIGTPNVTFASIITIRGPQSNTMFHLVQHILTDANGNLFWDQLQMRGADGMLWRTGVQKDQWYRVVMDLDFSADPGTADVELFHNGSSWWNPGAVTGFNDGNRSQLILGVDGTQGGSMRVDNVTIDGIPSRKGVIVIPDGQTEATLRVTPFDDGEVESAETVEVSLLADGGYAIGGDGGASATIADAATPPPATIAGRHVFYNRSFFDGNNAGADTGDDGAIASDKTALLPGQTATFANYTSYSRGINGIMIDIAGLPASSLNASDFIFKVGNDSTPDDWTTAPAPVSITVRQGAGVGGADRVTLIWTDEAIKKQWLQVTALATPATGLTAPDVFYFGNAIGESGESTANAMVNSTDEIGARNNPRTFLVRAPIDFPWDYNRDSLVNSTDQILARNNGTTFLTALKLITAPDDGAALITSGPSGKSSQASYGWSNNLFSSLRGTASDDKVLEIDVLGVAKRIAPSKA